MPLDAALVPLARFLDAQPVEWAGKSAAEVRNGSALLSNQTTPAHLLPPVGSTEDISVPGGAGQIGARVYRPERATGSDPTVVFFHGGGFVLCSIESHDAQCREICRRTASVVVSVDYRLAPEAPFPAAVDDAIAATTWVLEHAGELGGDPSRVAVAGDSAGGNLAAVTSQALRDKLLATLLIYPVVDFRADSSYPSAVEHATDGVILTGDAMAWFHSQYVPTGTDESDPRLSPVFGSLAGLPPTVVTVAELDPLADQGRAYASALADAGVRARLLDFPGLIHGYFALSLLGGPLEIALAETCDAFGALLHHARVDA